MLHKIIKKNRRNYFYISIRSLVLTLSWLALTGCGGLSSSAEIASDSTSGDDATALFEDGPIDLPVTIAKLESPNPLNINVEFEDTSTTNLLFSTNSLTAVFTGAGDANDETSRAVRDPSTTPYVLVYNHSTGDQTIANVAADGSFSAQIAADTQQTLGVYALTDSDSTTASASPGLYYVRDSLGSITVTVSNSDKINDDMPFSIAPDGSLLFSVTDDDNTYELWRRNVDGSLPERILDDYPVSLLFADGVSTAEVSDAQNIFVLDRGVDLSVREILGESDTDSLDSWTTIIDGLETISSDNDNQITQTYAMRFLDADRVLIKHPSSDGTSDILEAMDSDGNRIAIIDGSQDFGPTQLTGLRFGFGTQANRTYVSFKDDSTQQTQIYLLDLSNVQNSSDGIAWQNRTTVLATNDFEVLALTSDSQGNAILLVQYTSTDVKKLLYLFQGGQTTEIADLDAQGINPAERIVLLSRDTLFNGIALCDEGVDDTSKQLLYYPIDTNLMSDQDNTTLPTQLTSNEELRSCRHLATTEINESYPVLSFFTAPSVDGSSQLSFILLSAELLGE